MAGTAFPAFVRAEYDPSGNGFEQFERAASDTLARTRRTFEASFDEIGRVINNAVGKGLTSLGSVNLDVSQFRQAAAQARAYSESLNSTLASATALARSTGDTSQATHLYIQALSAQSNAARRAVADADAQVATYTRLQAAMDATAERNGALAQSYRALFSEQARSAELEVAARRAQQSFTSTVSPAIDRKAKSASDSAAVFEEAAAYDQLRVAEEAAARGADLLAAAQKRTALEIGYTVKSARDSYAVFQAAADADERLAHAAAQAWIELERQTAAMGRATAAAREAREAQLAASSAFNRPSGAANFDEQVRGYKELAAAALAVDRGAGGSLNLGVEQHRAAAAAAEAQAIVLREVAVAMERTALAAGDLSEATRREIQAAQAAAREETEHAAALRSKAAAVEQLQAELSQMASKTSVVTGAQQGFTQSLFRGADGARAQRFAMIQVGQQMQDVAIGFAGGQRAATIFAQQLPQLGFALLGFENSSSRALQTLGKFGTFLSGPWGAALTIAGVALGALSGAFSGAEKASYKLTDAIDFQKLSIGELITAINQLNDAQRKANQTSYESEQQALRNAEASLKAAVAKREEAKAILLATQAEQQRTFSGDLGGTGARGGLGALSAIIEGQIDDLDAGIKKAQDLVRQTQVPIADRNAKAQIDEVAAATLRYDQALGKLRNRFLNLKDISSGEYQAQKASLDKRLADEIKAARDTGAARRRAAREALADANAQASAETRLQKIIEQNTEQPSRVKRANIQALDVDKLEGEITRAGRMTDEIRQQITEARQAIRDNLLQPYRDYVKEQEQGIAIGRLVASGRDVEARALQDIFQLQEKVGALTRDQVQEVLNLAQAQERVADAIEDQRRVVGLYVDAVHDAQRTFETFLGDLQRNPGDAFKNLGKNLKDSVRGLQTKLISEQIFGGLDREIEKFVKGQNGIEAAGDYLTGQIRDTGDALEDLIKSLLNASRQISGAANDNSVGNIVPRALLSAETLGDIRAEASNERGDGADFADGAEIIVEGTRDAAVIQGEAATKSAAKTLSAAEATARIWDTAGNKIVANIEQMLGVGLPAGLGSVVGGGVSGFAQAGEVGAVLGALKGLKGLPDSLKETLGSMIGGAQTGMMAGSIAKAFGAKSSSLGSAIGGAAGKALGTAIGGPLGGAIGSVVGGLAGGLIGGAFKKTKKGTATLGYDEFGNLGVSGTSGNSKSFIAGATKDAGGLVSSLQQIADQLGGTLGGNIGVSIGRRDKKFVVDTTGSGKTKGAGVEKFKDQTEAIKFALQDAIADGVILGLRAGTRNLIQKSGDLETQLGKAVKFENVFKELRRQTDPVGAAIDDLNDQFTELQRIFKEAGASAEEYSQLEQLYALQRKQAVESAASQMTNTLKSLMQDLTTNNDAFSLKDRLGSALAEYNPLASRVAAGDKTVDYDAFAEAARNVLDIQRQLSGSQDDYFSRLTEVTNLTAKALKDQENIVSIANANTTPFDVKRDANPQAVKDNADVVNSLDGLYGMTLAQFATLNSQTGKLVALAQTAQSGVRTPYATRAGF